MHIYCACNFTPFVITFDQEIELRVLRVQLKQELSKRYYILFHLLAFFSGSKTDQKLGTQQQIALSVFEAAY